MNFVQKDKTTSEEKAFKVTYIDENGQPKEADLTKVTEEGIIEKYETKNIYSMPLPNTNMGFECDVLMDGVNGTDWFFEVYQEDKVFADTDEHTIACEDGKKLTIWFSNEYNLEKDIHIVIKAQDTKEAKKVLVITPKK